MSALLNDAGAAWAAWVLPEVVQDTVFLLLVLGALRLLRGATARARAAVATVGLVKLALPPFLPLALGGGRAAEAAAGVSPLLFPFTDGTAAPAAGAGWTGGLTLPAVLLAAWVSLALARLGWVALQTAQIAWAVRDATPLPSGQVPAALRRRGLGVWRSAGIGLPLTLGPWPRRVYVPADWDAWAPDHRAAALRHELAHVTRRDGLVKLLEIVVQAAWWFHPLVHLLVRRLRTWREMACDDAAVAAGPAARLRYSRFLADLALRAPLPLPAAESASTSFRGEGELLSRVSHQIREGTMSTVSRKRLAVVATALVVAALPLSLVLAEAPAPPAPPPVRSDEPVPAPQVEPVPAPAAEPAPAPQPAPPGERLVEPGAPPAAAPVPPPPPKRPRVTVSLRNDALAVNGVEVAPAGLADALAIARGSAPHAVVVLDTDGGVAMARLHEVQAVLRAQDLRDVIYADDLAHALPLVLPPAAAQEKLAGLPPALKMTVAVDGAGAVTVDGEPVAGARLADVVSAALAREDKLVVVLQTRGDTRYGAFVQVLGTLKEAGATRIAVQDPAP